MTSAYEVYLRRVVTAVGVASAAVVLLAALWALSTALLLVFGGMLLAVLLRELAALLAVRTGLSEQWSTALVIASLFAGLAAAGFFLWSEIAEQFDQLGRGLVELWERVERFLRDFRWGRYLLDLISTQHPAPEQISLIGALFASVVGGVAGLVISIFIGLYVAIDPALYRKGVVRLTPLRFRDRVRELLDELYDTLSHWLLGTFVLMIFVGVSTGIGLWLIGVPMPLALGIIAFLTEFIPYIGPWLAAIPALLIASTSASNMFFTRRCSSSPFRPSRTMYWRRSSTAQRAHAADAHDQRPGDHGHAVRDPRYHLCDAAHRLQHGGREAALCRRRPGRRDGASARGRSPEALTGAHQERRSKR